MATSVGFAQSEYTEGKIISLSSRERKCLLTLATVVFQAPDELRQQIAFLVDCVLPIYLHLPLGLTHYSMEFWIHGRHSKETCDVWDPSG